MKTTRVTKTHYCNTINPLQFAINLLVFEKAEKVKNTKKHCVYLYNRDRRLRVSNLREGERLRDNRCWENRRSWICGERNCRKWGWICGSVSGETGAKGCEAARNPRRQSSERSGRWLRRHSCDQRRRSPRLIRCGRRILNPAFCIETTT